jgi:hypothetical protein
MSWARSQRVCDGVGIVVARAQAGKLGLTVGKMDPFDMFQNERHTTQSNFRADSDLELVDCGAIVPEIPSGCCRLGA